LESTFPSSVGLFIVFVFETFSSTPIVTSCTYPPDVFFFFFLPVLRSKALLESVPWLLGPFTIFGPCPSPGYVASLTGGVFGAEYPPLVSPPPPPVLVLTITAGSLRMVFIRSFPAFPLCFLLPFASGWRPGTVRTMEAITLLRPIFSPALSFFSSPPPSDYLFRLSTLLLRNYIRSGVP